VPAIGHEMQWVLRVEHTGLESFLGAECPEPRDTHELQLPLAGRGFICRGSLWMVNGDDMVTYAEL
jgi:hypothetical protein